jgi:PBP1b-binding outer membrane lipoprotein LpoB
MTQIIKKFHPLRWMTPIIILATFFIVGCNNESTEKDENTTSAPVEVAEPNAVKDSLSNDSLSMKNMPPVDSNATSRPEPRKTK